MSGFESTVFVVLWALVLLLALLVLVLYRQLDRLIVREQAGTATLLPAGSTLPDLLVVMGDDLDTIDPPSRGVWLLGFVTTTCGACQTFLRELAGTERDFPSIVVVRGQELENEPQDPTIQCRWIANPGDLPTYFGVSVVPTLYLLRDKTVLAATIDGSSLGIQRLLEAGRSSQIGQDGAPTPVAEPLPS
jgi:hypothetical protein